MKNMEEKLVNFKRKLGAVADFLESRDLKFMVVGSGALLTCGIPIRREVGDIDLEVCCSGKGGRRVQGIAGRDVPSKQPVPVTEERQALYIHVSGR